MISIFGFEISITMLSIIFGIIIFILQFLLCIKCKKISFKIIPSIFLAVLILIGTALVNNIFGEDIIFILRGLIILFSSVVGAIGDLLAWVAYILYKKFKK